MRSRLLFPHSLSICLLLIISILSHRVWFNPFAILTNGDVWFLYKEAMLTSNWGTWASLLSLGGVNVSYNLFLLTVFWQLAAKIGLNYQIANQVIYFFPVIFITPLATYAYLYFLTKSRIASFCGSVFYMFPTFFLMSQNGGLLYTFVHAILPLIFLFFERYVCFGRTKDGILLILSLSLSIVYELRVTYIVILMFIGYSFFLFILRYGKKFSLELFKLIWRAKYLLILFLGINAYIYLPTLITPVKDTAAIVTGRGIFGSSFFTIKEPLVLMHPFWSGTVPTEFIPQPIPFYFWLFPLYAFLSFYFIRHNKKIIFFLLSAILLVFLGKSSADPWGNIYISLYNYFPGFNFYREPSKFWPVIAFSYAVLISFSVLYIPQELGKRVIKPIFLSIGRALFYAGIILTSLWVGKPAFTQELGPLFNNLQVTKEHFIVKDFIATQKAYFRTYYVPGIYRMGYGSEIHPMLGLYDSPSYFQTFDPKLLSLLSVKYIIFPPDITNDVYRGRGRRTDYEKPENLKALEKLNNPFFGKFSVYENTIPYKPHIYTISNLDYIVGEKTALPKVISLAEKQTDSYYLEDPTFTEENAEDDKKFFDNSSEVFTTATCIRCESRDYRSGFYFPFARFLPDSPFYGYIKNKEDKALLTYQGDTQEHLRYTLFYALKRLLETQRVGEENLHQEYAKTSILEQRKLITIARKDIQQVLQEKDNDNNFLLSIYDNLSVQSSIINNIFAKDILSPDNQGLLRDNQYILFDGINHISPKLWVSEENKKRYFINIPEKGVYTPIIENLGSESAKLRINDFETSLVPIDGKWMKGNNIELTKGIHKLEIDALPENLVKTTSVSLDSSQDKQIKEVTIPINNIEGSTDYIVNINYRIPENVQVHFTVNREFDFAQAGYVRRAIDQYLHSDNIRRELSLGFSTRVNEKKAYLKFLVQAGSNSEYTLSVNDIKVIKSTGPLVVFKKIDNKKISNLEQPTVTFQWINPMKYKVYVENARKPFYLVFSETFDKSWQAYYTNEAKPDSNTIASYDKEKVRELEEANNLDLLSFLSLFKKQQKIPVHSPINGYANAWYVEKPGTYTITIEFMPQRIFTFSLAISAFAFIVAIVIYISVLYYHEKK